jgi:hypothetical protein
MRQFYIMHEQCVKIFKAYTHEIVLYLTINTRKQKQIRQKQSLVHKVPSGVAILSRVSDVAAIVHPQNINVNVMGGYISGKYGETRNSLSLSSEKRNGSRHLVFWSLGTLTGLRDWVRGLVA